MLTFVVHGDRKKCSNSVQTKEVKQGHFLLLQTVLPKMKKPLKSFTVLLFKGIHSALPSGLEPETL